jgi:hypothetical protein
VWMRRAGPHRAETKKAADPLRLAASGIRPGQCASVRGRPSAIVGCALGTIPIFGHSLIMRVGARSSVIFRRGYLSRINARFANVTLLHLNQQTVVVSHFYIIPGNLTETGGAGATALSALQRTIGRSRAQIALWSIWRASSLRKLWRILRITQWSRQSRPARLTTGALIQSLQVHGT